VTIMAYRNTAAAVLTAAAPEVAEAARLHRPAHIGVNVGSPGVDLPSTTMLGLPALVVFAQLHRISVKATLWPGYAGLAVNDSNYLGTL
jgi:hypothetical protein